VGLVTDVGGLEDKSFNHLADKGMLEAEARYGISGRAVQSASTKDYVPNLTAFARSHTGLTIAVGFSMSAAVYKVASAFPKARFALIDASPTDPRGSVVNLPNVANIYFEEQQAGYFVGVIAGLMEKYRVGKAIHNTIGYLGGFPIPAVDRYFAGYVAGAQHVDPGIRIVGGYANTWVSEPTGRSIGVSQINQGADILFQVAGETGFGYLAAAQQRGVYGIGVDANQSYLGPFIIASALKRVPVAVLAIIRDAQLGRFRGGDHRFGAQVRATSFAASKTVVPRSIITQARYYRQQVASGKIVPPVRIPAH
jgi:basic membrane protein A